MAGQRTCERQLILAFLSLPKHEEKVLVQAKLVIDAVAVYLLNTVGVAAQQWEILADKLLDEVAELEGSHFNLHLLVLVVHK